MKFLGIFLFGCVTPLSRNSVEEGRSLSSGSGNNSSNSNDNLCNQSILELEKQFGKIDVNNSNITYNRAFEDYEGNLKELFNLVKLINSLQENKKNFNEIVTILSGHTEDKKLSSKVSSDLSFGEKATKVCNEDALKKSVSNINTLAKKFNDNLQKDYNTCQNQIKKLKIDNVKSKELDQYKEDEIRIVGYNKFLRIILPHLSTLEDSKTIPVRMNTSKSL